MTKNVKEKSQYGAEKITVLKGLEAVRRRPAMYIGDVGKRGLHHLVYEVIDNSVDEALAGACTKIKVIFNKDESVTVEDNGRGIPVDIHKVEKVSGCRILTVGFDPGRHLIGVAPGCGNHHTAEQCKTGVLNS